jgi:hypothetical protein
MSHSDFDRSLCLRLLGYAAVQFAGVCAYTWTIENTVDAGSDVGELKIALEENGWIEWTQTIVLASIVAMLAPAFRGGGLALHRLLAFVAAAAVIRELDSLMGAWLFRKSHMLGQILALAAGGAFVWIGRRGFKGEAAAFMQRPGFYLMFSGVVLVVILAQVFGQRQLWKLMAPHEHSVAKRFVEEGLELMGYLAIACGAVEERFFGRSRTIARRP